MSTQVIVWSSMAFDLTVVAALFFVLPRLSRPDIYFAVTVPVPYRDSDEGRQILRRYRWHVGAQTALAVLLAVVAAISGQFLLVTAGVLWLTFASLVVFLRARNRVLPHSVSPTSAREAELAPRRRLPGSWILQLGPFAILALVALILRSQWDHIPASFPVHWGIGGSPDRWSERTVMGVYGELVVGAVLCLLMVFLAFGILRYSRPINVSGTPGEHERSFRRTNLWILLGTEYFLALTSALISLLPLISSESGPGNALVSLAVLEPLFVVVILVVLVRMGQGGARLAPQQAGTEGPPTGDRSPDTLWKWGLFYVNPGDPAIFVQKRIGIGYTLNFGNRWSWVVLALIFAIPLLTVLLRAAS